jgi:hypothetical protein
MYAKSANLKDEIFGCLSDKSSFEKITLLINKLEGKDNFERLQSATHVFGKDNLWIYNTLQNILSAYPKITDLNAFYQEMYSLLERELHNITQEKLEVFCQKLLYQSEGGVFKVRDNLNLLPQTSPNQKPAQNDNVNILQQMNANGDDRNLSTHGSNGNYWYSIRDGMALLVAIRKAKLNYASSNEYIENNLGVFLANPYHEFNFGGSLLGDIERIQGQHGVAQWNKPPRIIIIPVLSGLHWRCVRVQIDYINKRVSILFDDPYGKGRFGENLKTKIRESIKLHVPKLLEAQVAEITFSEVDKGVNQQGNDNGSDCGPIVFGNIEDYCDTNKINEDFVTKDGFTVVSEASDPNHSETIEALRFRHITEFNEVSDIPMNEVYLTSIREAIRQSNNKRKASFSSDDADIMHQIEALPAEYVSHIFDAVEVVGIPLKEAYESIVAAIYMAPGISANRKASTTQDTDGIIAENPKNTEEFFAELNKTNKIHDLEKCYKIYRIILEYEESHKPLKAAIIEISKIVGGERGITFNDKHDKDTYVIRNRYGYIQRNQSNQVNDPSNPGRIYFEYLYRIHVILENEKSIEIPQTFDLDLKILKQKILYVLTSEVKKGREEGEFLLEKLDSKIIETIDTSENAKGSTEDLKEFYEFVKQHYPKVVLARVKKETELLQELKLIDREQKYFFARKMVVIGELCHELETDCKIREKLGEKPYVNLKAIFPIFGTANSMRIALIHRPILLLRNFSDEEEIQNAEKHLHKFAALFHSLLSEYEENNNLDGKDTDIQECKDSVSKLRNLLCISAEKLEHDLISEIRKARIIRETLSSDSYKKLLEFYNNHKGELSKVQVAPPDSFIDEQMELSRVNKNITILTDTIYTELKKVQKSKSVEIQEFFKLLESLKKFKDSLKGKKNKLIEDYIRVKFQPKYDVLEEEDQNTFRSAGMWQIPAKKTSVLIESCTKQNKGSLASLLQEVKEFNVNQNMALILSSEPYGTLMSYYEKNKEAGLANFIIPMKGSTGTISSIFESSTEENKENLSLLLKLRGIKPNQDPILTKFISLFSEFDEDISKRDQSALVEEYNILKEKYSKIFHTLINLKVDWKDEYIFLPKQVRTLIKFIIDRYESIESLEPLILFLEKIQRYNPRVVSAYKWSDTKEKHKELISTIEVYSKKDQDRLKAYAIDLEASTTEELDTLCKSVIYKSQRKDRLVSLLKKIQYEIEYLAKIEKSTHIDLIKKQAIIEHTITVIGQYISDITDIRIIDSVLLSNLSRNAGLSAKARRSKGLAHEVFSLRSSDIISLVDDHLLPASEDFEAITTIFEMKENITSYNIRIKVGLAYLRLGLYIEAAEQFQQALAYIDETQDLSQEFLEKNPSTPEEDSPPSQEDLSLLTTVCRVQTASHLADSYGLIPDFEKVLEAVNKVIDDPNLNKLLSFKYAPLSDMVAILYVRRGEAMYYLDEQKYHQEIIASYNIATKLALTPHFVLETIVMAGDRVCKLLRDTKTKDMKLLEEVYENIILIYTHMQQHSSHYTAYFQYKILSVLARIALLKHDNFLTKYNELLEFLNVEKRRLSREIGDKAELLIFDAFRIKLDELGATKNLSEIEVFGKELDSKYALVKNSKVGKAPAIGYCFQQYSDILIGFCSNLSIAKKSEGYLMLASNILSYGDHNPLVTNLAHHYYSLWRSYDRQGLLANKQVCEERIVHLEATYNIHIPIIKLNIEMHKHYQNAISAIMRADKIKHYNLVLKCLETLQYLESKLDDENYKNLGVCYYELGALLPNINFLKKAQNIFLKLQETKQDPDISYYLGAIPTEVDNIDWARNALLLIVGTNNCTTKKLILKPDNGNLESLTQFLTSVSVPHSTTKNSISIKLNMQNKRMIKQIEMSLNIQYQTDIPTIHANIFGGLDR